MIMKKAAAAAAALLLTAAGLLPLQAAADTKDMYATATTDDWHFEITPYAWLAGVKGTVTVRDHPIAVDESFSDIFKYLKFGAGGLGIAHYKQWLIWTQIDYLYLNTDKLENPPSRGNVNLKFLFWTTAGGYQFNLWKEGQTLDVLLGAQGAAIRDKLTLYNINSWDNTRSVVDTVLILRPSFRITEHWRFNPTLSYGGGESEDTYQLQPQFQYQFTDRLEARIGYRKLHYNIRGDRSNVLDLDIAGPLIGFGWTF